jgi:hypothetical protein
MNKMMNGKERYEEYKDDSFDTIIMKVKNGQIPAGRYSGLVKIKKDEKINEKELFNVKYNIDNDQKYLDGIRKKKNNQTDIEESVNTDDNQIQYFTE